MRTTARVGIVLLGVLQIVLIVLKFLNITQWSWTYVFCPLWITLVILVISLVVYEILLLFELIWEEL